MSRYFIQKGALANRKTSIESNVEPERIRDSVPAEWSQFLDKETTRWWGVGKTHSKPEAGDYAIFIDRSTLEVTDVLKVLASASELPELAKAIDWQNHVNFPYVFPLELLDTGRSKADEGMSRVFRRHLAMPRTWTVANEEEDSPLAEFVGRLQQSIEDEGRPERVVSFQEQAYVMQLAALHLLSGRNLILYGPPGSGKTRGVREICRHAGARELFETANPEWTSYDAMGFFDSADRYVSGFVVDSVSQCHESLRTEGRPTWLILDEINRSNIDLVFGRAFTLLDVEHPPSTPLLQRSVIDKLPPNHSLRNFAESGELQVPLSFRVLGTMNSYDRTLLFKLGYALQRRFAMVPWSRSHPKSDVPKVAVSDLRDHLDQTMLKYATEQATKELSLHSPIPQDTVLLRGEHRERLDAGKERAKEGDDSLGGLSALEFSFSILGYLEGELERLKEEGIGVEIAQYVDTARFVVASKI
ncbi:MAG: AAA family ATPase, partial [Thermoplasmata archaeon]